MESGLNSGISAIVPVYNGIRFLAEALESVWQQTCRPDEVIIVDDGSTDGSVQLVAQFEAQMGSALRYSYQENRGQGSARNRGVEMATGAFLAFLDHDDVWLPRKLEHQRGVLTSTEGLDGVFGLVQQWRGAADGGDEQPLSGVLPSALLISRDSFLRVGFFETEWKTAEWAGWYRRALDRHLKFQVIPELVARRRLHDSNNGLLHYDARIEYTRVLRASLARRRAGGKGETAP